MKTYVIFAIADFVCTVEGKQYKPKRAMIGEIRDGACVAIKLIKCVNTFDAPTGKRIEIYFDENGKAVSYKNAV